MYENGSEFGYMACTALYRERIKLDNKNKLIHAVLINTYARWF